ncbi:Putative F-box/FBD/LRR-repeat protein At4g03220 [Linum grandiflorum]
MENTSTADKISELPDEILHCILSRIKPQRKAAQTITLSRRWRSLWRSYPVVDFSLSFYDGLETKRFQKFCEATIKRFSRDKFLGMKALNLDLTGVDVELCFPVLKQLLDLSSERKAEEIDFRSFTRDPSITLLPKLQHLKTLTLDGAKHGKKLKLSNPKLEEFTLRGCCGLEEIEIDAGPSLVKFLLELRDANYSLDEIKKFQISNVRTEFKEDDHSMPPPVDIKHLTIQIGKFWPHHIDLLGRLFGVLRPRYLTIMQDNCNNYEMFVLNFLELMKPDRHGELFQEKEYDMYHNWQGQLKDIKIATSVVDRDTKQIVEAAEFLSASKRMVTKLRTVSFMLTWLVVP